MCAHAVRVAVQKLEGVASVEVSLNEGLAVIRLEPANRVALGRIREVIRSNGFAPKEAVIRVSGILVEREEGLALSVSGPDEVYLLAGSPAYPQALTRLRDSSLLGKQLTVEGRVPGETGTEGRPLTLEVHGSSVP